MRRVVAIIADGRVETGTRRGFTNRAYDTAMLGWGMGGKALAAGLISLVVVGCASPPTTPTPPQIVEPEPSLSFDPLAPDADSAPVRALLDEYAAAHADEYSGAYIDPPGGSTVVMLFTDHISEHEAAIRELVGNARVLVRQGDHTLSEMLAALDRISTQLHGREDVQFLTGWVDESRSRVGLEVRSDDPLLESTLEAAHFGMLEVTVYPLPGPWSQPLRGDGWRLIAHGELGSSGAVDAATDAEGYRRLWQETRSGEPQPEVDLEREVVISFSQGLSDSCPELRLDEVVIVGGTGHVFGRFSDPLAPRNCNFDLSAGMTFVVAIQRDRLPLGGFTLLLTEDSEPCVGPDCRVEVLKVVLP